MLAKGTSSPSYAAEVMWKKSSFTDSNRNIAIASCITTMAEVMMMLLSAASRSVTSFGILRKEKTDMQYVEYSTKQDSMYFMKTSQ